MASRCGGMSEASQIEENLETLKGLFHTLNQRVKELEDQKAELLVYNKTIIDVNKTTQESMNRLFDLNDKQNAMLDMLDETIEKNKLLEIELDSLKKENSMLKKSLDNSVQNSRQPPIDLDYSTQNKLKDQNLLLQKKVTDLELELQIILNQTQDPNFCFSRANKQVSNFKSKYNSLLQENKSLKGQISNIRKLHNETISEIRVNNLNIATGDNQQQIMNSFNFEDSVIQNELQPLRVNVIDIDVEDYTS